MIPGDWLDAKTTRDQIMQLCITNIEVHFETVDILSFDEAGFAEEGKDGFLVTLPDGVYEVTVRKIK